MVEILPPAPPANQQDPNALVIPPRLPRTHIDPDIIQLLKELPLYNKLEKNKSIEAANLRRQMDKLNHKLNPNTFPTDGSDIASLVTINEDELNELLDDKIRSQYRPVMYIAITKWVHDTQKAMTEGESPSLKRGLNAVSSKKSFAEATEAKRRCMDGSLLTPRVCGVPTVIKFPQIMFDTENCVSIPLPFFLNKNLRHIIDKGATLPTVKSNPLAGETKGLCIIDVEKLSATLGKEGSLTCSQWTEAAYQLYQFQQQRDADGPDGAFASWYNDHFNFFNTQDDRDELYEAWKDVELLLRREFRRVPTLFDSAYYVRKYDDAKAEARILAQIEATSKSDRDQARGAGRNSYSGKYSRPVTSHNSFPSSSSRSPLPPCCILCGQRGHTLFNHANDSSTAKFSDGKTVWAKFVNRILRGPDNREICIKYNLRGDRQGCAHGKDERAHICSFCGKLHFAFSWTCRPRPDN